MLKEIELSTSLMRWGCQGAELSSGALQPNLTPSHVHHLRMSPLDSY